ncbi:MAG: toll/interleukin-1 receptor domain-containing protein [Chitinophagaceae bacterium]|nr:toll/interleukin-1 receptor domain-containing protein [Chitinophagaceae bacterium]
MPGKLKIFLSYSHEDEAMKVKLDRNLVGLRQGGKIDVWQDRMIMAGDVWDDEIKNAIATADIILLLISVDFNNSKYIWENELKVALERHANKTARVIPVILRTCDWTDMPYAKLQALPTGAKPISSFDDADVAYTDVARGIRAVVDYMLSQ